MAACPTPVKCGLQRNFRNTSLWLRSELPSSLTPSHTSATGRFARDATNSLSGGSGSENRRLPTATQRPAQEADKRPEGVSTPIDHIQTMLLFPIAGCRAVFFQYFGSRPAGSSRADTRTNVGIDPDGYRLGHSKHHARLVDRRPDLDRDLSIPPAKRRKLTIRLLLPHARLARASPAGAWSQEMPL